MSNGRQYPRYAIEAAVTLTTSDGAVVRGRSSNVSRGGLAAVVDAALAPGDTAQLEMSLVFGEDSFSEPLELTVRVVWSTAMGERHQLGTSFLALSAEQRQYLDMFLRYLAEGIAAREADEEDEASDGGDASGDPFDL